MIRLYIHPRRTFWRDISIALLLKATFLAVLYFAFFAAPPQVPEPSQHLFNVG